MDLENSRKRRKANSGIVVDLDQQPDEDTGSCNVKHVSDSLKKSISPPAIRRYKNLEPLIDTNSQLFAAVSTSSPSSSSPKKPVSSSTIKIIPSPVQLSTVDELPVLSNIDAVSLKDILGDPLIKECWLFNYLFDVDFIL